MKRLLYAVIAILMLTALLCGCAAKKNAPSAPLPTETVDTAAPESGISKDMAYEGVFNYCRSEYNWNVGEEDSTGMYLCFGEDTETEYELMFRSYTGAYVLFYVDKTTGITRLVDYVPTLDQRTEAGSIDVNEYIKKQD